MTIPADRGLGRAEWAAVCQPRELRDAVRIKPDVTISRPRDRGVPRKDPARRGMAHPLEGVARRQGRRVEHDMVIRRRPDPPERRDEPWFLRTDLDHEAERAWELHGRRMSIGELFRAGKSERHGQSLRDTKIGKADRSDRFRLAVALAYLVLVGLGLRAELDLDPSAWCTTRRAWACGVFTIGKAMVDRLGCELDRILRMIRRATIEVGSKWG